MLKYFVILMNLPIFLKCLILTNDFSKFSLNECSNKSYKIVDTEINSTYLDGQSCFIEKSNIWLSKRTQDDKNNIVEVFLSPKCISEFICNYTCKVLNGCTIRKFVLRGNYNSTAINIMLITSNKHIHNALKNKCETGLCVITIFYSHLHFPIGHRRKLAISSKYSKFHNIKKRSIAYDDYEAKLKSLNCYFNKLHIPTEPNETLSRSGKKKKMPHQDYLPKKIKKIIGENGHLTLNCPEVSYRLAESKVEWYKNNEKLNSSLRNNMAKTEKEPHLTIDVYNSLYILQATKEEEGIYTCCIDGKPYQVYHVKVVSKSKLLNQEFFRYSIYLGFVLSLTITCYCAGIFVAWHQRSYFADPLYISMNCK